MGLGTCSFQSLTPCEVAEQCRNMRVSMWRFTYTLWKLLKNVLEIQFTYLTLIILKVYFLFICTLFSHSILFTDFVERMAIKISTKCKVIFPTQKMCDDSKTQESVSHSKPIVVSHQSPFQQIILTSSSTIYFSRMISMFGNTMLSFFFPDYSLGYRDQ